MSDMRLTQRLHALLALSSLLVPMAALAQWIEGGAQVAGPGMDPSQVSDGAGGSILLWSAYGPEPDGPNIYASRISGNGILPIGWPAQGLVLCSAVGEQRYPTGVPDGSGGAIVVWLDGRAYSDRYGADRYGVYAHHVLSDGSLAADWPTNGTLVGPDSCTQARPAVAEDGFGGAYVAWSEPRPDGDLRLQHLMRDGTIAPGWPSGGVLACGAAGAQGIQGAVPDGVGGLFLIWDDARSGQWLPEVYAVRLTSSGAPAPGWPNDGLRLSDPGGGAPVGSTMCSDGAGGLIAFWRESFNLNPFSWFMVSKHIMSDGIVSTGWASPMVSTNEYSSGERADCITAFGGGAFVAWPFAEAENRYPVHVNRVLPNAASAPAWPPEGIAVANESYNFEPDLLSDGSGGAYVAWAHVAASRTEIRAQHLLADGSAAAGWPEGGRSLTLGTNPYGLTHPLVPGLGGGAIVAWWSDGGLYAQSLAPDGVNYFTFALAGINVQPDNVRLAWQASPPVVDSVTVYRQKTNTGWSALRTVPITRKGEVAFQDTDVRPGTRYGYRLSALIRGAERFYGEVQIDVPLWSLRVRSVSGNPVRHDLTLSVTMPAQDPAALQLFDVRGRLVDARDITALGIGQHAITLGSNRLASGIYFARLTQGGVTTTTRLAYLR